MKVDSTYFGTLTNGFQVEKYTLENRRGIAVGLSSFGAAITQLAIPDRNGRIENIVLGYDTVDGYARDRHNLGGTIGRYANRIANGRFFLDGRRYDQPFEGSTFLAF
jgi:aldose 1-epimerase